MLWAFILFYQSFPDPEAAACRALEPALPGQGEAPCRVRAQGRRDSEAAESLEWAPVHPGQGGVKRSYTDLTGAIYAMLRITVQKRTF